MEMILIKNEDGTFAPATDVDYSEAAKVKQGESIRVEAKRFKQRSLQHHRLYWAGLLELVAQYWEPEETFLASHERAVMRSMLEWFKAIGMEENSVRALTDIFKQYAQHVTEQRSEKLPPVIVTKDAIHEWMKIKCGYYDILTIPSGRYYKPKSINFNAMDQEQFQEFWRRAVNVAWRYVLSRHFDDEAAVNDAVNKLLDFS